MHKKADIMHGLAADVRYAIRSLRRAPAFFALVIGILALGIGASVSIFTIVDGVLLKPLPYRNPQQIVALTSVPADPRFDSNGSVGYADFERFRSLSSSFSDMAVTYRQGWSAVTLTDGPEPEKAQGAFVSPNFLALFGRSPILGRTFNEDENRHGERLTLLSEGLAIRHFGSAARAVGQDVELSGTRWRVIGIMPADFRVPFLDTQLWMPVLAHPEWNDREESNPQLRQRWDVVARLKPGTTLASAQAGVNSIDERLKSELPEFHKDNVRVVPLREHFTENVRRPLLILLASVGFVLLIACTNVGNLLLARAAVGRRELGVRAALGAGRIRLFQQVLAENAVVALLGGSLGVGFSVFFVPLLKTFAPAGTPRLLEAEIDARVLVFALVISCGTALSFGFMAGWNAFRYDMISSLHTSMRAATDSRGTRRVKSLLVVTEFAMAMVLLSGAVLLVRSFVSVLGVDLGFRPERVLTVRVSLPNSTPPAQTVRFYVDVFERIASLPGVQSVGGVGNLFFLEEKRTHALRQVDGQPPEPRSAWKPLVWTQVAGNYFQAMGIPLLHGRYFDAHDRPDTPPVAIVNETLARRYWPGGDPVGRRLKGFDPRGKNDDWLTVVGVVKDTRSGGLERAPLSQIYELQSQRGEQINNIVIKTSGDPVRVAANARALVRSVNRGATVSAVQPLEQLLDAQRTSRKFQTWLIGSFSTIALALAAVGVFAVMHYSVVSRQHEIGIRIAVGASAKHIFTSVVWDGTRLAIIGIATGLIAISWIGSALASMLFEIRPGDPVSLAMSVAVLVTTAVAASYLPARRATRVDPLAVLRQE